MDLIDEILERYEEYLKSAEAGRQKKGGTYGQYR